MASLIYDDALNLIKSSEKIALISHISPDGDTVGASLALYNALKMYGKSPYIFCEDTISHKLESIEDSNMYNQCSADKYDLAIAIDIASQERMGMAAREFAKADKTLNIDHHVSNTRFAQYNYVVDCAATCEIMFDFVRDLGGLNIKTAKQLYTGLVTDTGNFAFSSVTPHTFLVASRLAEFDIKGYEITHRFMRETTYAAYKLKHRALDNAQFYNDGKIALITIKLDDFQIAGADNADTEGIVNNALDVAGVDISVIITEVQAQNYKLSFRTSEGVNAHYIAAKFGGGGHKNASGCRLKGEFEEVIDRVLKACRDELPF